VNPAERPSKRTSAGEDFASLDPNHEDVQLLAELAEMLDIADPVPDDLADRTRFAIDLANLDIEVARWARIDELAGVRGRAGPSTITFTVQDLTVMVTLAPAAHRHRFDRWLVPGGPHKIEVRVDGQGSTITAADEGGRFALPDVPAGLTQIIVHLADPAGQRARTVVTPAIVL